MGDPPGHHLGHNYDMDSLYLEADGTCGSLADANWPQRSIRAARWRCRVSSDQGRTWKTGPAAHRNSPRNHTYVRRRVNAHPDFYALVADGHARQPSESRCTLQLRRRRCSCCRPGWRPTPPDRSDSLPVKAPAKFDPSSSRRWNV